MYERNTASTTSAAVHAAAEAAAATNVAANTAVHAAANTAADPAANTDTNNGAREGCKGCSASVHVDQQQLDRILASLHARPEQCVDEATYKQRLAICHTCPSLAYDTTCMHCGCLVAVRALLKNQACPYPGQARWS